MLKYLNFNIFYKDLLPALNPEDYGSLISAVFKQANKTICGMSVRNATVSSRDFLPLHHKLSHNRNHFKSALKNFLYTHSFYSMNEYFNC
jgi:hypothetical protein